MKIYNKKYLFIGIFTSLVTACGSGSGSGNSPSSSAPSSSISSKPSTDMVSLPKLETTNKAEEKPKVPEVNKPSGVDNSKPKLSTSVDKEVVSAPQLEESKPVQSPKSSDEIEPSLTVKPKEEVLQPEKVEEAPTIKPEENEVNPVQPKDNEVQPNDMGKPEVEASLTKNTGVLNVEEDKDGLIASSGTSATNEASGTINITKKDTVAILSIEKNSKGINKGTINGTQSDSDVEMILMEGREGGNLENSGTIEGTGSNITAMSSSPSVGGGFISVNDGNIKLKNIKESLEQVNLIGMEATRSFYSNGANEQMILTNNKNITVKDSLNTDLSSTSTNIGGMKMTNYNSNSTTENKMTNNRTIDVTGLRSFGMKAIGSNVTMTNTNKGIIKTNGRFSQAMVGLGENIKVTNEGTINIDGLSSRGIIVSHKATGTNETSGFINVGSQYSSGMEARRESKAINKGKIVLKNNSNNSHSNGMFAFGQGAVAINEGIINMVGNSVKGIYALDGGSGTNEANGSIQVTGRHLNGGNGGDAYGMYAFNGSKIINKGKIILKENAIGMYAGDPVGKEGIHSSIVNEGEIILKGKTTSKVAIKATENATYINNGKILDDNGLEITTSDKAKFIVGKEASGNIAVVRSKRSLKIDGNVVASKDLIDGNKKEIVYSDVFSAPKVELGRATDLKAVSLFYNSKLALNNNGNADMLVYRNKATVAKNYESTEFKSLTNSLDRYLSIENINLSEGEKLVIDRVLKADSINDVRKVVKNLSGEIYANLPRQIFDIQDRFVKEDMKLIDSLNEHSYNFNFFGDKTSVKNKGEISGYKSTSGGFVGTKKFQDNLYATIGYENSNIKYSEGSKGSIQSIHTGFYKKLSLNDFNIDLGLNGEYNFHETNREIDSFNVKAKGKYNSYSLGANTEISRVYGESLYFKPSAGLSLGYGQYEKFTEKNAGDLGLMVKDESYFSVLPKIGFKAGKNFEFVDIYSNIIYSYELGDLNKKQGMSLLGDKVQYTLNSDSLEKVNLAANLGVSTEIKDFKLTLEVGKEFGKRENNYLALGVGYKF